MLITKTILERLSTYRRRWILSRIDRRVTKTASCWNWKGASIKGYGTLKFGGRQYYITRLLWTMEHGEIPRGMAVLHDCDNPACVRVSHLFLGTRTDNNRDRDEKGRTSKGEEHHDTHLTNDDVLLIRQLYTKQSSILGGAALAKRFDVSVATIYRIVRRKTWKHI